MLQTWRWFGPTDAVSIDDLMQAGVQGVVSALHHVLPGDVWLQQQIEQRQTDIARMGNGAASGLVWSVVESLPVSEDIKRKTGAWKLHIRNYCESLSNLRAAGIEVVCYNFMPVLDWTRTDLAYPLANGATCMRFDYIDFAVFDLYILKRENAAIDFSDDIIHEAEKRFAQMSEDRKKELLQNIVCGLPGAAESLTIKGVRESLAVYNTISAEQLRANLIDFLSEVAPHAQKLGIRLCCHPDDPPIPLLGLPRIMSTQSDYQTILDAVNVPSNGVTLCSGSLGARSDNNLPQMMEQLGDRVHFLHLRNVKRESASLFGSFHEAEHLGGDTDMVALIAAIVNEERRRHAAGRADVSIPFRPDHGQNILDDHKRISQPGYPAIGRLKGLAELRGIEAALTHSSMGSSL